MRVALFGRTPREEDLVYVQSIISDIETKYSSVVIHKKFFEKIKDRVLFSKDLILFSEKEELIKHADILLSLGGDGTLLETLPIVGNSELPILGINIGHLGFLTSVGRKGCSSFLDELAKGQYSIEHHSIIKIDEIKGIENKYALNDICLRSAKAGELLDISIYVDNEFLATYTADGIIINTPTGSTAYSMSAGGPIISPKSLCLGITPICPHNLTFRPIIIPDNSKITLQVKELNEHLMIYLDSQCNFVSAPFEVNIQKSEFSLKLIRMHNQSFFTAIRNKLMWGTYIRGEE